MHMHFTTCVPNTCVCIRCSLLAKDLKSKLWILIYYLASCLINIQPIDDLTKLQYLHHLLMKIAATARFHWCLGPVWDSIFRLGIRNWYLVSSNAAVCMVVELRTNTAKYCLVFATLAHPTPRSEVVSSVFTENHPSLLSPPPFSLVVLATRTSASLVLPAASLSGHHPPPLEFPVDSRRWFPAPCLHVFLADCHCWFPGPVSTGFPISSPRTAQPLWRDRSVRSNAQRGSQWLVSEPSTTCLDV